MRGLRLADTNCYIQNKQHGATMWLIQCPVITCNGKESEMEHTHIHHTHTTHTHTTHTHTPHTHTHTHTHTGGFPGGSDGKESACDAGEPGLISGSGRSPRVGNGNPLQHSSLGNPMDIGSWGATVHGVANSQTQLSNKHSLGLCACVTESLHCILDTNMTL